MMLGFEKTIYDKAKIAIFIEITKFLEFFYESLV